MVKLKGESSTAKIIDLGLAKGLADRNPKQWVRFPEVSLAPQSLPARNNMPESVQISAQISTH